MRTPSDKDKRFLGRLRTSLMGMLEVPMLEWARRHGRDPGQINQEKILGMLGDSWGSRVIPVGRSIAMDRHIIIGEEIDTLLDRALVHNVSACYCRHTARNCDHPVETCIGLWFGESYGALKKRTPGTTVKRSRIKSLVDECHERGLIHQTVYYPSPEYFYVICNCCSCCCIPLKNMREYGNINSVVTSSYVAVFDPSRCNECLSCTLRCHFSAMTIENADLHFNPGRCYGCGLCVTTCSRGALALVPRTMAPRDVST